MYCWEYHERTQYKKWNGRMYDVTCCELKGCNYRARKLLNLRIFEDPDTKKPWDKSVSDLGLEILCVSQVCTYDTSINYELNFLNFKMTQ